MARLTTLLIVLGALVVAWVVLIVFVWIAKPDDVSVATAMRLLPDLLRLVRTAPGHDPRTQVPDLWWPTDQAWFVAADTDLDWTVVGCSDRLASDLLRALPERSPLVTDQ